MIIGFSGYAGCGKDTAADFIASHLLNYEKISFANTLRECMEALNPIVLSTGESFLRYNAAIALYGYRDAKDNVSEIRALLQRMGTDMGRKILGENVWVDALVQKLDSDKNYVISDVRFPNEYDAVKSKNGVVIRIHRPGYEPTNAHPSETALDNYPFDYHLYNDKTLYAFEQNTYILSNQLH